MSVVVVVGGQDRRGRRRGSRRSRRRRSLRAPRGRASASGGPTAIWRRLRQSTESQRRACSRSWVAMTTPCPSPASAAISSSSRSAAGPVEAGEGLVEQQHPGVLDQGAGDQHPLALAAGELAEGLPRRAARGRPGASAPRAASRSARPGRRHQGSRESAPIVATSRAETG